MPVYLTWICTACNNRFETSGDRYKQKCTQCGGAETLHPLLDKKIVKISQKVIAKPSSASVDK